MTSDSLIKLEYQLLYYAKQKESRISDFTFLLPNYMNRYD